MVMKWLKYSAKWMMNNNEGLWMNDFMCYKKSSENSLIITMVEEQIKKRVLKWLNYIVSKMVLK